MTSKKDSVSLKTDKKSFDILKKTFDPDYSGEWMGSFDQQDIFYNVYIKEKYKDELFFIPHSALHTEYGKKKQGAGGGKNGDVVWIDFHFKGGNYIKQVNKNTVKNELLPYIKQYQNSKKRFHFFNIGMILWVDQEEAGHSVSGIYDKKTHQVDFFNTTPAADLSLFDKRFQLFFKKIYGNDIKLDYSPECLKFGEIEDECDWLFYRKSMDTNLFISGPCAIWTLWFLELRLKNKNLSREEIIDKALKIFNDKKNKRKNLLCKVIYDYAVFVDKITQQYNIKRDPETGIVTIEYKKTPKNNRILKMILAALGIFLTSGIAIVAINKKK